MAMSQATATEVTDASVLVDLFTAAMSASSTFAPLPTAPTMAAPHQINTIPKLEKQ